MNEPVDSTTFFELECKCAGTGKTSHGRLMFKCRRKRCGSECFEVSEEGKRSIRDWFTQDIAGQCFYCNHTKAGAFIRCRSCKADYYGCGRIANVVHGSMCLICSQVGEVQELKKCGHVLCTGCWKNLLGIFVPQACSPLCSGEEWAGLLSCPVEHCREQISVELVEKVMPEMVDSVRDVLRRWNEELEEKRQHGRDRLLLTQANGLRSSAFSQPNLARSRDDSDVDDELNALPSTPPALRASGGVPSPARRGGTHSVSSPAITDNSSVLSCGHEQCDDLFVMCKSAEVDENWLATFDFVLQEAYTTHKADLKCMRDRAGRSPLHVCANGAVLKRLLRKGFDVHTRDLIHGEVPLSSMLRSGDVTAEAALDITELMHRYHADLSAQDSSKGDTPLHVAAERGFHRVVRRLLQLHAKATIENMEGRLAKACAKDDRTAAVFDSDLKDSTGRDESPNSRRHMRRPTLATCTGLSKNTSFSLDDDDDDLPFAVCAGTSSSRSISGSLDDLAGRLRTSQSLRNMLSMECDEDDLPPLSCSSARVPTAGGSAARGASDGMVPSPSMACSTDGGDLPPLRASRAGDAASVGVRGRAKRQALGGGRGHAPGRQSLARGYASTSHVLRGTQTASTPSDSVSESTVPPRGRAALRSSSASFTASPPASPPASPAASFSSKFTCASRALAQSPAQRAGSQPMPTASARSRRQQCPFSNPSPSGFGADGAELAISPLECSTDDNLCSSLSSASSYSSSPEPLLCSPAAARTASPSFPAPPSLGGVSPASSGYNAVVQARDSAQPSPAADANGAAAAEAGPGTPPDGDRQPVYQWLRRLCLEDLWPTFERNGVVALQQATQLTPTHLSDELGIRALGDRWELLEAIQQLENGELAPEKSERNAVDYRARCERELLEMIDKMPPLVQAHRDSFVRHRLRVRQLPWLSETQLQQDIGVTLLGDRLSLLSTLKLFKSSCRPNSARRTMTRSCASLHALMPLDEDEDDLPMLGCGGAASSQPAAGGVLAAGSGDGHLSDSGGRRSSVPDTPGELAALRSSGREGGVAGLADGGDGGAASTFVGGGGTGAVDASDEAARDWRARESIVTPTELGQGSKMLRSAAPVSTVPAIPRTLRMGDVWFSDFEPIGRGNFGAVYKAIMHSTQQLVPVAMKMLHDRQGGDDGSLTEEALLMMELMQLKHRNILRIFGCAVHRGTAYMVLEYAVHGNLYQYIHKNSSSLSDLELLDIAIAIADAMRVLSSLRKPVIHRDLHLLNLLLDEDERGELVVKVADFGLSRLANHGSSYISQTPRAFFAKAVAPEAFFRETGFTEKSDVWSFGVALWQLFSRGSTPYSELPDHQILQSVHQGHRLDRPQQCPDEVWSAMLFCWMENPDERPSFAEMHTHLLRVRQSLADAATAATVHASSSPTAHRFGGRVDGAVDGGVCDGTPRDGVVAAAIASFSSGPTLRGASSCIATSPAASSTSSVPASSQCPRSEHSPSSAATDVSVAKAADSAVETSPPSSSSPILS